MKLRINLPAPSSMALACLLVWHGHAQSAPDLIVVGQSMPMGVSDDGTARRVISGTRAYIEAVNARGGIGGRQLKLMTIDNGNDPARDSANVRSLINEHKAVAILSCIGDSSCRATAAVASELGVPLVGPMAASKNLNQLSNPMVFRVRVAFEKEAVALARQIVALAAFKVALVTDQAQDSETVTALQAALQQEKVSATIVPVDRTRKESFEVLLKKLAAGKFQAVLFDISPRSMETIVNNGLEKRDDWPLILAAPSSGTLNSLMGSFKGRILGFTAVVPNPESDSVPLVRELQADVEKYADGSAVTYAGLEGYVNAKLLVEALRHASPNPRPEKVAKALSTISVIDVGGMTMSFKPGRISASDFVEIVVRSRQGTILK